MGELYRFSLNKKNVGGPKIKNSGRLNISYANVFVVLYTQHFALYILVIYFGLKCQSKTLQNKAMLMMIYIEKKTNRAKIGFKLLYSTVEFKYMAGPCGDWVLGGVILYTLHAAVAAIFSTACATHIYYGSRIEKSFGPAYYRLSYIYSYRHQIDICRARQEEVRSTFSI